MYSMLYLTSSGYKSVHCLYRPAVFYVNVLCTNSASTVYSGVERVKVDYIPQPCSSLLSPQSSKPLHS